MAQQKKPDKEQGAKSSTDAAVRQDLTPVSCVTPDKSPDLSGLPFPMCMGMGVDYNKLQDSFNTKVLCL